MVSLIANYAPEIDIYYGMDKYTGCNIVESKVTIKPKPSGKASGKRPIVGFLTRVAIAGVIVGGILALHYVDMPILEPIKAIAERVFCYDVFGRTAFGTSAFFG